MKQTMKCKQARTEIALHAGDDLDSEALQPLSQHLAACPCCRVYRQNMERSLQSLQNATCPPAVNPHESVWPIVFRRLPAADENRRRRTFNGWMPAAAMCAACLALIAFSSQPAPQSSGTTTLWGDHIPRPISLQAAPGVPSETTVSWPDFRENQEQPSSRQLRDKMRQEQGDRPIILFRDF